MNLPISLRYTCSQTQRRKTQPGLHTCPERWWMQLQRLMVLQEYMEHGFSVLVQKNGKEEVVKKLSLALASTGTHKYITHIKNIFHDLTYFWYPLYKEVFPVGNYDRYMWHRSIPSWVVRNWEGSHVATVSGIRSCFFMQNRSRREKSQLLVRKGLFSGQNQQKYTSRFCPSDLQTRNVCLSPWRYVLYWNPLFIQLCFGNVWPIGRRYI